MDWQLTLTCCAIALAGGYVLWRSRRALRNKPGGCGGGCGCVKETKDAKLPPALIAPEQLTMRPRLTKTNE